MSPLYTVLCRKAIAKPLGFWALPTAMASPACHSVTVPVTLLRSVSARERQSHKHRTFVGDDREGKERHEKRHDGRGSHR